MAKLLLVLYSAIKRAIGDIVTRATPPGPGSVLRVHQGHIDAYLKEFDKSIVGGLQSEAMMPRAVREALVILRPI